MITMVDHFERVLRLVEAQDAADPSSWQTRYIALLWMSTLVLQPFSLERLCSGEPTAAQRVVLLLKSYLMVPDKAQDAAAFLAARFLSRPDMKDAVLPEFLDWAVVRLANISGAESLSANIMQKGLLHALAQIFKHARREDIQPYSSAVLTRLLACNLSASPYSHVQRMFFKVLQRIGLTFLPARVASWRYQRGLRSLEATLASQQHQPVEDSPGAGDSEDNFPVAPEVEDVLAELLKGLQAQHNIVRWSAAKGVGRVAERLPRLLGQEVVGAVLERGGDGDAQQGACLALAELGRRGALLPEQLPVTLAAAHRALLYHPQRGGMSVRDSACFLLWSLARTFPPAVLQPHMPQIVADLLTTALFDREVNCRRAASAAFQEHVGRQGSVDHGIDILTLVDFQAVGSRSHCYLDLSVQVAKFPGYGPALVAHLMEHKLNHWDSAIRSLAAQALGKLTVAAPVETAKLIPRLLELAGNPRTPLHLRHGTILALGELWAALPANRRPAGLILELDSRKLLRGVGSELMKTAACTMLAQLSAAGLPLTAESQGAWRNLLTQCLQQVEPAIRDTAVAAVGPFYNHYFPQADSSIVAQFISKLKTAVPEAHYGLLIALGALPLKHLCAGRQAALDTVAEAVQSGHVESRRAALRTLVALAKVNAPSPPPTLYRILLTGLRDYTMDSRGDIGSTVREAAMQAALELVRINPIPPAVAQPLVDSLLQQCMERINRTRGLAGTTLSALLRHRPPLEIKHHEKLEESCPTEGLDWSCPRHAFPALAPLLALPAYSRPLLLGLLTSAGDLTESLVVHARDALFTFLGSIQDDPKQTRRIYGELLSVFEEFLQDERVGLPYLRASAHILGSGLVPTDSDFPLQLAQLLSQNALRSKNPQRLLAVVEVLCAVVGFPGRAQRVALSALMLLLCHRYPRVRLATAERLYEALLASPEPADPALLLLSETAWDQSIELLRPLRNDLARLLDIPPPVPTRSSAK
ncbi:TBCD [Cordylochernes scorpioides]|uniref:Tubulin-specific chaperone D n=1 Tax=Cordylochernes scorpioides TaxID=51811 RepID=A0ABY6K582_9ARAC|nr:TBCD [Cordylochernes scorpioides]